MNVEELLNQLLKELLPASEKKIILFLTGGSVNAELIFKILGGLPFSNYSIALSDSAKTVLQEAYLSKLKGKLVQTSSELETLIEDADLVLIPIMTRNTLVKAALGIADNLVSTGIAQAIMMKKDMIALRDSFDPENPESKIKHLSRNSKYNNMLIQYEQKLKDFGVQFVDITEFESTVKDKWKTGLSDAGNLKNGIKEHSAKKEETDGVAFISSQIITMEELMKYENLKGIKMLAKAIITPLAKDFLESHQIQVEFIE